MIHLTPEGIVADTVEERQAFYDRLCSGDPIILGHLAIWKMELEVLEFLNKLNKDFARP